YAWPLPNFLCPIWIYLDVLFSTSSIMHLCAISLDRYVGIRSPIEYSRFNSRTKAKIKIAAVWTISVVISMPIPVIGLLNKDKVLVKGSCVLNEPPFVLLGSFVAFFIPLVIMVVTYCLTVRALQHQASDFMHGNMAPGSRRLSRAQAQRGRLLCLKRNISHNSAGGCENISIIARSRVPKQLSSPSCQDLGRERGMIQAIKNERRASKVLGVVFFLFLVMWCPFFITNVMNALCNGGCNQPLVEELLNVFVWVGYSSSGVNPLIYTLFNKTYRHAFSRYMRCRYSAPPHRPLLGRNPCPSHMVTPTSLSSKNTVDRNSNCQNGDGNTLSSQELDGIDEGLEMQSGTSKVSIESADASRDHTSSM
ncbi:5-hydroxytryptamine receptor 2C-like, partial [Scleropages formosus]